MTTPEWALRCSLEDRSAALARLNHAWNVLRSASKEYWESVKAVHAAQEAVDRKVR